MQKILRGGAIVAASAMLLSCSTAIIPEGAAPPAVASRPVNPPARIPQYNPRSQPSPALVKIIHRSEEHTSELQSLMRISYAVFCFTKKKQIHHHMLQHHLHHNFRN